MIKNSYPKVFDRLDQGFSNWEEEMWAMQLSRHLSQIKDVEPDITQVGYPVDGFEETRSKLLQVATREDLSHLLPDFRETWSSSEPPSCSKDRVAAEIASGKLSDEVLLSARWYRLHLPYYLGQWNTNSRRIYHLPEDLVLMLQATSLRGRTFRDLRFPFPSFALALECPIITDTGQAMDFILLSGESTPEAWYAFAKKLGGWKPTDVASHYKIKKAMSMGNHQRFQRLAYKPITDANRTPELWTGYAWPGDNDGNCDVDIEDDLQAAARSAKRDEALDWTNKLFRVVIGFTFYLQAFHESQKDLVTRIRNEDHPKLRASSYGTSLVSPEEIFKVQSIFSLSREERDGLSNFFAGRGGWEVNTHFREGHWRRPPGEGDNPLAQKTVWVRPTMVRRDRLAENTLPMGTGVNA